MNRSHLYEGHLDLILSWITCYVFH